MGDKRKRKRPTVRNDALSSGDDDSTEVVASEDANDAEGVAFEVELALRDRYIFAETLGQGGMGTITAAHDVALRRDVAVKSVREDRLDLDGIVDLFVQEARVQGRLDHPAIVSVYDIGVDDDGFPFFTMQRVQGTTLREVLKRQSSEAAAEEPLGPRRLLDAFVRVCLAVDFAHAKGVLHGDLKPSNIMFGAYGEVYVLDWGGARSLDDAAGGGPGQSSPAVGSPAYMAPELRRGDRTPRRQSDIYALGAILFEIVTGGRLDEASTDSVRNDDGTIGVAPELLEVIRRATAAEPSQRYGSARELSLSVERHLEGARDEERRRQRARDHADNAEALLRGEGEHDSLQRRTDAIAEIGRALALDPSNTRSMDVLLRLVATPPSQTPPEVERQLEDSWRLSMVRVSRIAAATYLAISLTAPVFAWAGVVDIRSLVLAYGLIVLSAGLALLASRRGARWLVLVTLLTSSVGLASTASLFGPLLVMPMFVAVNIGGYALLLRGPGMKLAAAVGTAIIFVPWLLETVGSLPPSYVFADGAMVIHSRAVSLSEGWSTSFLLAMNTAAVFTSLGVLFVATRAVRATQRQLLVQTWHFRQLAPSASGG